MISNIDVVILHSEIKTDSPPDEQDTMHEAESVSDALEILNYKPHYVSFNLDTRKVIDTLLKIKPKFVFNLVESIEGKGELAYLPTSILDYLKIPYTGCSAEGMFLSSNKLLAKKFFRKFVIPTADWITLENFADADFSRKNYFETPFIIKSCWEHASIGLDDNAIFSAKNKDDLFRKLTERKKRFGNSFFAERFIDGREFNVTVISNEGKPEIMPIAEMRFLDFPEDKFKLLDYKAKWDTESFEYKHTERTFEFKKDDNALLDRLKEISIKCWNDFNLSGYVRVDFRVDSMKNPYVLEINANPCISKDGGFIAACQKKGMHYEEIIQRIITGLNRS